ncbi:GTA head formation protein, RCAP_rcc01685 family [Albidovulum sp.]
MTMAVQGSRYLKEPFQCSHEHRLDATERIMALQFETVEKRLERIEAMVGSVERRIWMTVFGVVGVILSQAVQSIVEFGPR